MIPVVTWGGYLTMGYFPKFSHVHQIIKFQVCLQILSLIACCSPADTLALEQSKWNELRQSSSLENQQLCKAKKSKEKLSWRQSAPYCRKKHRQMMMIELRGEIPAISAAFCGNSVYIDFDITPRLRACVPVGPNNWKRVIWLHTFLFLAQNLIHCFSVFSSILAQVYLTFPFESSATSSKISISLRKWKLHHLRRVSIKLEGRRNGNVEIENPSSGKQNTKRKKGKWKLEKRKSQHWKTKSKKKENTKSYAGDFFLKNVYLW